MRRSQDRNNIILEDAEGQPYGVFLAADYTSAHEQGIEYLQLMFGIDRTIPGIPGRTIQRSHPAIAELVAKLRIETPESQKGRRRYQDLAIPMLVVGRDTFNEKMLLLQGYNRGLDDSDLEMIGAFSNNSFAIAAYTDRAKIAISEIKKGLETNDLIIMMGGGNSNPFARGGLVIARASKIPAEQANITLEADLEANRLDAAAVATGIKEKLDGQPHNHGRIAIKRYFALSPAWANDKNLKGRTTNHLVIFFLNPSNQSENNYGWFTVEELELWLEGKGPIPKTAKARSLGKA